MNLKITGTIVLLSYFSVASIALSDIINVPTDQPTIAAAINASDNGDVIEIEAGTYFENALSTAGKSITIMGKINPNGFPETIVDGQFLDSVFRINSGEGPGTIIQDLVIRNGDSPQGGGINCSGSNPTIKGCLITENYGYAGGGISCYQSNPTIINCRLINNSAGSFGGGIRCLQSMPSISDCVFSENVATQNGGGIFLNNNSNAELQDCTFTGNLAGFNGGGIMLESSNPDLSNCKIQGNISEQSGAGIYFFNGNPTLTGCIITDNQAGSRGGGFYCTNSSPTINSCIISTNVALSNGGGIYSTTISNPPISGTTVCENIPVQIYGNWNDEGGNAVVDVCPADCIGDATGDGQVDVNDVLYLLSAWGTDDPNADFDNNGSVDVDDILELLSQYGTSC